LLIGTFLISLSLFTYKLSYNDPDPQVISKKSQSLKRSITLKCQGFFTCSAVGEGLWRATKPQELARSRFFQG
jgi:hypothetical protein